MRITGTEIFDVRQIETRRFTDSRGYFVETFNKLGIRDAGITGDFVQDNLSCSKKNVIRGIHYQITQPQGKLARVLRGEVYDVAVDLRRSSPTFGKHVAVRMNENSDFSLWIPPGFGHGFLVLSAEAVFSYKVTAYYAPSGERTILWNDPDLAIDWPLNQSPVVSAKDCAGSLLRSAEVYQ